MVGAVTNEQTGEPIAGATVILEGSRGGQRAFTDDEGRFEISGAPQERFTVQVQAKG